MRVKHLIEQLKRMDAEESVYFAKPIKGGYQISLITDLEVGNMGIYLKSK